MSNVKLAIRVRPFTDRELNNEKERVPVVSVVDDKTVAITNVKVSVSGAGDSRERVRRYFADYTFDSACAPDDPAYASQEKVFEVIGREVASSVSRGQSACVLAYGQSATGKTHTMMGSDHEPGLVPRLCRALAEEERLDITVSFLEIYNERVHDLLAGEAPQTCHSLPRRRGNALKDLRVREHPSRGPYVQNLRRVAVHDVCTLLSLVSEGVRRRRTAATRRNSTSSRSHALLELATPTATLHLADLAGSEKASWEGSGGGGSGRQKEGANINKSLVALSNVISALVSGGYRGRFVPYRDSALTWLLKDCFTGGASTFIIATVSPSVCCYGESASTLRWAARARQLPSPRPQSTGPLNASRTALQAQLNQLIAELGRHHIRYIPETGRISYGDDHWLFNIKIGTKSYSKHEGKIESVMNFERCHKAEGQTSESTASSVASGSSDAINTMDKNIKEEINKEVDKVFGPALERTQSGIDIETTSPLRHKKRQYKSQEILPVSKLLQVYDPKTAKTSPSQSHDQLNETGPSDTKHVPILYDNQRAEIVASVTERLYSKLKKREETAVHKVESMVDRKIMEPLSELRICTNARQRLMELSQKAMRNKRRIGIPAHTQTKARVTRVRDQGVDVQTDLVFFVKMKDDSITLCRDVATETISLTPRCKEIAVGPVGSLDHRDSATLTETKRVVHKNTLMMTDVIEKFDRCSQTVIVPPPRRKRRSSNFSKNTTNEKNNVNISSAEELSISPVITINISQNYSAESDIQSSDDNQSDKTVNDKHTSTTMTPDLLTNHNTGEANIDDFAGAVDQCNEENNAQGTDTRLINEDIPTNDFPEPEEPMLPRVTIVSTKTATEEDLKDIILGRNNKYPYNIVVSPPKQKERSKRTVKFRDFDAQPYSKTEGLKSTSNRECNLNSCTTLRADCKRFVPESRVKRSSRDFQDVLSDSDSSKVESDSSFVWKRVNGDEYRKPMGSSANTYTPVYKCNKYKTAKAKIYKEFLGLDDQETNLKDYQRKYSSNINLCDSSESDQSLSTFRQRRQFFEDKYKHEEFPKKLNYNFSSIERNLLDSCNRLDATVNKYESYLAGYHFSGERHLANKAPTRTPTEYLQHLVQIRRDLVKDCDATDSSTGLSCN